MERNIDDFLDDISEAKVKEKFEGTPGFKLKPKQVIDLASRLVKLVDLEIKTTDLKKFKEMINDMKRYNFDVSHVFDEGDDESDNISDYVEKPNKILINKIKSVSKIFDTKDINSLSEKEKKEIEKVATEIINQIKTRLDRSSHNKDFKETGKNSWQVKFEQSFPCKLEIGNKVYYGLVRPPTGVITWAGASARGAAHDIGVPIKLPVMNAGDKKNPDFRVKRGADKYGEFMSKFQKDGSIDFDFDDSKVAKAKVIQALKDSGADYDSKAYKTNKRINNSEIAINNMKLSDIMDEELSKEEELIINEGIIKNVKFWQDIAEIF